MKAKTLMTIIDKNDGEDRSRARPKVWLRWRPPVPCMTCMPASMSGDVQLDGKDSQNQQLIKTGLERGLEAKLRSHVGIPGADSGQPG